MGLWKKCSRCGVITDCDENYCPQSGSGGNPKHELQILELGNKEVERLREKGSIWTKHPADVLKGISQQKAH